MKNDGKEKYKAAHERPIENGRVTAQDVRISMSKRSAKKSSNKKIFMAVFITLVTCLAALAVIDIVFFNVESIVVTGNERYSTESIIESSGIEMGTNFLLIRPGISENAVRTEIPGIKEVRIKRKLPKTVELKVVESTPVMYVTVGEFFYTIDENMVVLEKFESFEYIEALGLMRVYFPEVSSCITGDYIETRDGDVSEMLSRLYKELCEYGFSQEVVEIDFRDKFDIKFTLGTRFTVKLGNIIDCDIKLEFLKGIISELDEDDVGTIDLSDGDIREAIFSRG